MYSLDSLQEQIYDEGITEKGGGPVEMIPSSNSDGTNKREVAGS
jgi:hypothetical protein